MLNMVMLMTMKKRRLAFHDWKTLPEPRIEPHRITINRASPALYHTQYYHILLVIKY